jgi:hypothetical protein
MSLWGDEFEKPACQISVESLKRLVNSLCGFLISEIQPGYAEIEMGFGVCRFDLRRLLERFYGFRPTAEFAQSHTQVVIRLGPIRFELDRQPPACLSPSLP